MLLLRTVGPPRMGRGRGDADLVVVVVAALVMILVTAGRAAVSPEKLSLFEHGGPPHCPEQRPLTYTVTVAMRTAKCLLLSAALFGLAQTAWAADAIAQFRLTPDSGNSGVCGSLNAVLERVHTLTLTGGDAELTSAGGIEGRMAQVKTGVYRIDFELDGRRLDVVADLAPARKTLVVTERNRRCRWLARAE